MGLGRHAGEGPVVRDGRERGRAVANDLGTIDCFERLGNVLNALKLEAT